MNDGWRSKHAKVIFDHPHVQVEDAEWDTPERSGVRWLTVHRKVAVVIAPRTSDRQYLLICEERPSVQQTLWTFPAGQVDVDQDAITETTLIQTGRRELLEETGYLAEQVDIFGHYHSSPGFTSERLYLLLADRVTPAEAGAHPESEECILDQRLVTANELRERVLSGELQDGPSLAMYAHLSARGYLS